jgi:hypothetical protein
VTWLTVLRLLSLKGDLDDKCQGVYADIITNSEPSYARIYVGSAAGVYKGRRDSGLCRRIKEHMASMKKGSRPESGMLHAKELNKATTQTNFVILVRFTKEVDLPTVRIAEALMTILFCAWDSQAFHSIRPKSLAPISRNFGLNNANPLTGGFMTTSDFSLPEDSDRREEHMIRCRLSGKRRAAKNLARSLENARLEGPVTVTCRPGARIGAYRYGFNALKHHFSIPSELAKHLGLDKTKSVRVVYDIAKEGPHHAPYACKARYKDSSRRLGIALKGDYVRGPLKGLAFQKWLQCGSTQAIVTARSIIELIQQPVASTERE